MKPVMSSPVSTPRRVLRVLTGGRGAGRPWLAGLVAALAVGILGMHGLAGHGTPAAAAAPAASMAQMSTMVTPAVHDAGMATTSHADHDSRHVSGHDSGHVSGHDSGHGTAGTVMLCVVMLAAAALTLLVVLAAGVLRPLLPDAFMPATVREQALQWVRGTGPPHEWQFSVIRC
jgi:hypothetical protein